MNHVSREGLKLLLSKNDGMQNSGTESICTHLRVRTDVCISECIGSIQTYGNDWYMKLLVVFLGSAV